MVEQSLEFDLCCLEKSVSGSDGLSFLQVFHCYYCSVCESFIRDLLNLNLPSHKRFISGFIYLNGLVCGSCYQIPVYKSFWKKKVFVWLVSKRILLKSYWFGLGQNEMFKNGTGLVHVKKGRFKKVTTWFVSKRAILKKSTTGLAHVKTGHFKKVSFWFGSTWEVFQNLSSDRLSYYN